MESPVSLGKVLRFGSLLVAIQIFGTVATRRLGNTGLVLVSILGATVSSASTTAAAANLSAHGHASQAIVAAVATSIMSTMMNLPATLPATENKTCISPCFFWRQLYNSLLNHHNSQPKRGVPQTSVIVTPRHRASISGFRVRREGYRERDSRHPGQCFSSSNLFGRLWRAGGGCSGQVVAV